MLTPKTHILVVAFSIIDPRSLNNVMLQYIPLRKNRSKDEQTMILVGLDSNKRDTNARKHISEDQATQALKNLKGHLYVEVGEVREVGALLQLCAKAILRKEKTDKNKNGNFLSKTTALQKSLENKETLETIALKRCKLEFFPPQLFQFRHSVSKLKLSQNLFKFFPDEVCNQKKAFGVTKFY